MFFVFWLFCSFNYLICTLYKRMGKEPIWETNPTKKKGQETFCFCCCVEEGTKNFVLLLRRKKKTKANKNADSLLFLSILHGWVFLWALSRKLITWAKCATLVILAKNPWENWQKFPIRQVKSTWKFLHALKAFPRFSFVYFHLKIIWHFGKVNEKGKKERVSNWIDAQSSCLRLTSFNVIPLFTP